MQPVSLWQRLIAVRYRNGTAATVRARGEIFTSASSARRWIDDACRKPAVARRAALALFGLALLGGWVAPAQADKRTVCTITVNSADEKEAMRRHLPASQYEFVELVESGRPDWLESACQKHVKCDVLVVSGHFNGHDFFSDQLDAREYLPVAEMERVSCSKACPGLFSQLKEVYLFGCTSLSPDPANSRSTEIERRLLRAGQSRAEAERVARMLADRYEENNREFMRRVFRDVPAIYGFSNVAPLGPVSGQLLTRYFQSGSGTFGTGRPNPRLLATFSAHAMAMASGLTDTDPRTRYRAEVCGFVDDRLSPAQKLRFIHQVLARDATEARMFFERIEAFFASLEDEDRNDAAFASALGELEADTKARDRYLAYARGADNPGVRARMVAVAGTIGWLTPAEVRDDQVELVADLLGGRPMSTADLDVVCRLNPNHELDGELARLGPLFRGDRIDRAAALACLGSAPDHARMLAALISGDEQEVRMAEIYFRHRPIEDVVELRAVAAGLARVRGAPDAQAYALDTLSRQYVSDAATLDELLRYFSTTVSLKVQRAIAGILIRADYLSIATPELVAMLREHRVRSPDGADAIDILIRRMQASYAGGGGVQPLGYQRTSARAP
jgi:hypothetical protein